MSLFGGGCPSHEQVWTGLQWLPPDVTSRGPHVWCLGCLGLGCVPCMGSREVGVPMSDVGKWLGVRGRMEFHFRIKRNALCLVSVFWQMVIVHVRKYESLQWPHDICGHFICVNRSHEIQTSHQDVGFNEVVWLIKSLLCCSTWKTRITWRGSRYRPFTCARPPSVLYR